MWGHHSEVVEKSDGRLTRMKEQKTMMERTCIVCFALTFGTAISLAIDRTGVIWGCLLVGSMLGIIGMAYIAIGCPRRADKDDM